MNVLARGEAAAEATEAAEGDAALEGCCGRDVGEFDMFFEAAIFWIFPYSI